jgi:hypothetical protein
MSSATERPLGDSNHFLLLKTMEDFSHVIGA